MKLTNVNNNDVSNLTCVSMNKYSKYFPMHLEKTHKSLFFKCEKKECALCVGIFYTIIIYSYLHDYIIY